MKFRAEIEFDFGNEKAAIKFGGKNARSVAHFNEMIKEQIEKEIRAKLKYSDIKVAVPLVRKASK